MKNTDTVHIWMIIPLLIVQLFIGADYYFNFLKVPWAVHVHFFTVTAWYILLISQPYLVANSKLITHRNVGIFGFSLAGGVGFTGLSMLPNTVGFGRFVEANPGGILKFEPSFFYAIAVSEFFLVMAFFFAIYKAIIHRRERQEHATWLISTAFIMLFPAVGRGVQNLAIATMGFEEDFFRNIIVLPIIVSATIIIGLTIITAVKFSLLSHRAFHLAIGVNIIPVILWCFPEQTQPIYEVAKAVFTLRFEGTKF